MMKTNEHDRDNFNPKRNFLQQMGKVKMENSKSGDIDLDLSKMQCRTNYSGYAGYMEKDGSRERLVREAIFFSSDLGWLPIACVGGLSPRQCCVRKV